MISFLIPALVGIALTGCYNQLPEIMPVHWNYLGIADRFWAKSLPLVFAHVLTAWGVLLVLHVYVPSAFEMSHRNLPLSQTTVSGLSLSSSVLFSGLAAHPLLVILAPGLDLTWITWLAAAITLALAATLALEINALPSPDKNSRPRATA